MAKKGVDRVRKSNIPREYVRRLSVSDSVGIKAQSAIRFTSSPGPLKIFLLSPGTG